MSDRALTIAEFSERYAIDIHTTSHLIKAGVLRAINVGKSLGKRAQYRIPASAIAEFELARQIDPAPKSTRRRKPTEHQFKYY